MTSNGELYAPKRFKQIVEERYQITKHTNTSYGDIGKITPIERTYLLEFIKRDLERKAKMIKNAENKTASN